MVLDDMSDICPNQPQNANLLDDTETVIIVTMEYVRTHECEYGHDIVQNRSW